MLNSIIEKVKIRGNILLGKVYGYTDQYTDLKELLLSNTFSVVPSLRFGHHQKNNLDIQLVIDALEVAYTNELIDCFCIVSGDSDYTPLVGKLKSMGKFVLGISRSEVASGIFISACNEFLFLESVAKGKSKRKESQESLSLQDLDKEIVSILDDQYDTDDFIFASELKNTLLRLHPDFNERNFGHVSFGKLLSALSDSFHNISCENDGFALKVRSSAEEKTAALITKENLLPVMQDILQRLREDGFDRVNPSVIKAAIVKEYPSFDERSIGCKKFSDLLKLLQNEGLMRLGTGPDRSMLVHIL